MIEPKKHTIHFQVKNHINWSERIYIKGKIPELGNMDPGYAVPLNVVDEQYWSAEVRINPDQQTESDTIEYEYFIASFDDPLQNVREFQVRIKREFSLSALKERYMHIRDEWNVEGDFPSRVKIFDPKDRVFLNFQIKREIYYGEAIYIMGPLEALANDQELGRVSAVRTEWHPGHVWKGTFDIGLDQIFALNGHLTFSFYRSYYYKRCVNEWRLVARSGNTYKLNELENIKKLWQDQNVDAPLWIDIIENEENNFDVEHPDEPPKLLHFVYESPYEEDPELIVAVYVICKAFNPVKMERRTKTKWHAEVWVSQRRIIDGGLIDDFYFDVHRGSQPSNLSQEGPQNQINTLRRPSRNVISSCQTVKGNVISSGGVFSVHAGVPNSTTMSFSTGRDVQVKQPTIFINFGTSFRPRKFELHSSNTASYGTSPSTSGVYTSSCMRMIGLFSNIAYNLSSYSTANNSTFAPFSQQIHAVSSSISTAIGTSSRFYHTILNAPTIVNLPNLKKQCGIQELGEHWKLVRVAVSKLEIKEDDGKKLIKDLAQDTSFIEDLYQLNNNLKREIDGIEGDNLQILRIQILQLAKSWALDNFTDKFEEQIFGKLNEFLEIEKIDPKFVISACLEVNEYCKTHFTKEVKEGHSRCQNSMQQQLQQHFEKYKNYEKPPIQKSSIYKNLFDIVTGDLNNFLLFAQEQGLTHFKWSQNVADENFMLRLLINYALLYSISRHFDKSIKPFTTCGCGRFGPYCNETLKIALTQKNLALLEEKYLSQKKIRTKDIKTAEEEIVKKEDEIIKKFENTTGKEVVAMTHIAFDLEKLRDMVSSGVHTLSIDVVIQDIEELEKEIDMIDQIEDPEKKLVRVNDLKTHKSLESIVRIHEAFTE